MKKEHLIQKRKECNRLLGAFLLMVLMFLAILIWVIGSVSESQRAVVGNAGVILLVVFLLCGILWIGRKTDVQCPTCHKSIQGGLYIPLALTTGKCGHCGARILDEPEIEPPATRDAENRTNQP